jgi:hypothetical protein
MLNRVVNAVVSAATGKDLVQPKGVAGTAPAIPLGISGSIPFNRDGANQVSHFANLPTSVGRQTAIDATKDAAKAKMALMHYKQYAKAQGQQMQLATQLHNVRAQHAMRAMQVSQQVEQTDLRFGEALYQHGFNRDVNRATVSGWEAAYQQAETIW